MGQLRIAGDSEGAEPGAGPAEIAHPQWQWLGWLALEGTPSLAERMRRELPTLAGIVGRMDRDGWLQRSRFTDDHWKTILNPTARVGPVWEAVASAMHRILARAAVGLSLRGRAASPDG